MMFRAPYLTESPMAKWRSKKIENYDVNFITPASWNNNKFSKMTIETRTSYLTDLLLYNIDVAMKGGQAKYWEHQGGLSDQEYVANHYICYGMRRFRNQRDWKLQEALWRADISAFDSVYYKSIDLLEQIKKLIPGYAAAVVEGRCTGWYEAALYDLIDKV